MPGETNISCQAGTGTPHKLKEHDELHVKIVPETRYTTFYD